MKRASIWSIAAGLCILPIVGCQPVASVPTQKVGNSISATPLPTDRQPTADEAVANDPCSTRLHDIEGALLTYYALNKHFPMTLEEIKPFADAGTELKFTCPVSNLPYGYSPAGLFARGNEKRIIVWDPTPVHGGKRWCIVMPRAEPGAALVPDVLLYPEDVFASFVPAIQ